MFKELLALLGAYSLFRFIFAGPKEMQKQEMVDEWDQIPIDASQIDHDLAVFAAPDDQHPQHTGRLRNLQEKRNMVRAVESRPMLDQIYFTRDNGRKLEVIVE